MGPEWPLIWLPWHSLQDPGASPSKACRESILGACVEALGAPYKAPSSSLVLHDPEVLLPPVCSRAGGLQGPRHPDPLGLGSKFLPVSRATLLEIENEI